jgi:hypothetical protein
MVFSPIKLLLACLNYGGEPPPGTIDHPAKMTEAEWRAVVSLAREQKVGPLLYQRSQKSAIILPEGVFMELKKLHLMNARRNICIYNGLSQVLLELEKRDCPVIVLKGAYLAEHVYDNTALRVMEDVDLLARKDDLQRIENMLLEAGYLPKDRHRTIAEDNHHFAYHHPRKDMFLEIHWSLLPAQSNSGMEMEDLWRRARPVTVAGAGGMALSNEDLVLCLCLHTARHSAQGMQVSMLCDIGEILRHLGQQLDWQEIVSRAQQWGISRAVHMILLLARELIGADVPEERLAALKTDDFDERYFELAKEQFLVTSPGQADIRSPYLAQLQASKGWRWKSKMVCERLLPPRATMARFYPPAANSWKLYFYYPVRIVYVLRKHGRSLWKLLGGNFEVKAKAEEINRAISLSEWLLSK